MEKVNVRGLSIRLLEKIPVEIEWKMNEVLDSEYMLLVVDKIKHSIKLQYGKR